MTELPLVTGTSRRVKEIGYDINKEANLMSQAAIHMGRLADQIDVGEEFVTDRTLLDSCAYNYYQLHNEWMKSESAVTLKMARYWYDVMYTITERYMDEYDYVIFVPKTFELVADGVRDTDIEYQENIEKIVQHLLAKMGVNYYRMPAGSIKDRAEWLMRVTGRW